MLLILLLVGIWWFFAIIMAMTHPRNFAVYRKTHSWIVSVFLLTLNAEGDGFSSNSWPIHDERASWGRSDGEA